MPVTITAPTGELQQHRQRDAHAQCRVGRVEHREALAVGVEDADHVDHVAVHHPGRPEQPVDEVAQGATQHQAERERPGQ